MLSPCTVCFPLGCMQVGLGRLTSSGKPVDGKQIATTAGTTVGRVAVAVGGTDSKGWYYFKLVRALLLVQL